MEVVIREITKVSEEAIKYLLEMKKYNGVISRGEMKHDYLTSPQDRVDYSNGGKVIKSEWSEGRDECVDKNLIERADSGSSYEYIKWKISKKGEVALKNYECPDKLVLLKRKSPEEYEIHRGKIEQAKNLILTTRDKEFAEKIVNSYNGN
jgi:hypothetical protein